MNIEVNVVNAFSELGRGGNPAGIVFNADHLSALQKQRVAAAAGFPETAFISSSSVADFKLDFFTPVKQIPHCGHATIAAFSYMKQKGLIESTFSSKETIDGRREIFFKNDLAFMEQRSARFEELTEDDLLSVMDSLQITQPDLIPGLSPLIVNTGNSFLIIPIGNEARLADIFVDREAVSLISEKLGLIGYYLFTLTGETGIDASTRMFAPYYGIDEEAGTGMAAGPLAVYLHQIALKKQSRFVISQGRYMQKPSPSLIQVELELDNDGISRLFAGGSAYLSGKTSVEIR